MLELISWIGGGAICGPIVCYIMCAIDGTRFTNNSILWSVIIGAVLGWITIVFAIAMLIITAVCCMLFFIDEKIPKKFKEWLDREPFG